ncbi:MAG: site-specific DNA-methyltransferase [Prevotella sp.]|nr:site-specific DNA-methyltransferase [Prevotella sp.]
MEQLKHIDMQTPNGVELNLDALYKIVPSCFTEAKGNDGVVRHAVDFNKLRLLLGDNAVEDAPEVYDFTWVGKRVALQEAAAPIKKTLRPCPEESVDWDKTQNIYIEGDNLEVLKLLQNSYMGKVKMIYIDPPYNTGNDFVYKDFRSLSEKEYNDAIVDDEGNRLVKNTYSNGSFHSDWCSMIYARLMVARSLLKEDGVIFISIDDNEQRNLKNICDEVFGEINFIAQLIWEQGRKSMAAQVAINHEYCYIYSKNKVANIAYDSAIQNTNWREKKIGLNEIYSEYDRLKAMHGNDYASIEKGIRLFYKKLPEDNPSKRQAQYRCVDNHGLYFPGDIAQGTGNGGRFNILHPITNKPCKLPKGGWRFGEDKLPFLLKESRIHFGEDETKVPCLKRYLKETEYEVVSSVFYKDGRGASKRLENLLGGNLFDFPKDEEIMKKFVSLITSYNDSDSIILDFFSGSASTAHAVMQLNLEDGGNRKFIMVQLPEETAQDSEAYKAGYKNICEIGKERIRRAGKKIKEESPLTTQDLDTGFRVFKCESSNYKDVAFAPKDYNQGMLEGLLDNIKEDRNDLDLLFDCMLRWGVELSLPLSTTKVDGCTIHNVNDGDLVACFDTDVTEAVIDAIAALSPVRVVFRDSCFNEAAQKMNLFELFKQKCDWTDEEVKNNVRVI